MKKIASLFLLLLTTFVQAVAQYGAITGTVLDEKKEPIIGAIVRVYEAGVQKGAAVTDVDGEYDIKPLNPGKYDMVVSYIGYIEQKVTNVILSPDKTTQVNFNLTASGRSLQEVVVTGYKVPLIDRYSPGTTTTITSEQIEKMPSRSTSSVVSTSAGVYQKNYSEDLSVQGSRTDGTQYIVDGVRVVSPDRGHNRKYERKEKYKNVTADNTYNAKPLMPANTQNESYTNVRENNFMNVDANPLSTMSVDVDRASYSNVRRYINAGQMPPSDAIRIEEMVNYFDYDYPQPEGDKPIAIVTELTECPWNNEHKLLHIGMQAASVNLDNLPPSNLVFLVDVSGSMSAENKLPLVKTALKMLASQLRPEDKISIVTYAGAAGLALPPTTGNNKTAIYEALNRLEAGGSTAGGAGIQLAYNIAAQNYVHNGNNRVILATDGDFNVGVSSEGGLESLITEQRKKGIYLTCLGFGMGNYKDSKMEVLADKGNGNYSYIDNEMEAKKTLVKEFTSTIFTVAKDVKAQIEFNPAYVQSYRLVGYENRVLNEEDFKDDKKDAGDMGSGHSVTIMYEIIPVGSESRRGTTPLKYRQGYPNVIEDLPAYSNELATIKFRYKQPNANTSKEITHIINNETRSMEGAGNNAGFATAVAMFGMLLKHSEYSGTANYNKVLQLARRHMGIDKDGYRNEFVQLVKKVNRNDDRVSWKEE